MLIEVACLLLTVVVLCLSMVVRPHHARCPVGWDLRTGIRQDGRFDCWRHPVGDKNWQWSLGRPDRSVQPAGVVGGKIWCTSGQRAVVIDDRAVGCQR